ncbi:aspartic peptidase domain-containing protein [Pisolithus croceorrhizus]|nr:aspartic peptidase domain-containing protein [Pisolithus croceorrhizus]
MAVKIPIQKAKEYPVQLDTGSSDLWVFPTAAPLPNATDSYGIGWAYGQIAYAQAEFAGISVSQQAYLNVSVAQNPALSYSSTDGDNIQGTFAVGETDPQFPTWPVSSPSRWTVLLDSFIVGTQTNDVSSTVSGVPSNKAVVLLDSGTSYTYAPVDVCTAIYGGVACIGQWVVPCDAEIDMALQIDNQIYPLNPLDITPTTPGDNSTCCRILPSPNGVGCDWLIGDNVLRSVYTLYDFGDFDSSGNYGQSLQSRSSAEFHAARGGTPLTNITYNVSNSGSGVTTVSLSTDVADTISKLSQYLPAMLGVMALNALVLTVLTIVGLVLLCRRRGKARARKTPGRLSPMPLSYTSINRQSDMPESGPHTYEPVSMALTEDTLFAPPSPAFKGEARYLERPKSIA